MVDTTEGKDLEKQLIELREWAIQQPQIAKDLDDQLLRRFIHSCYYDIENTKKTVMAFSSMRANTPELFANRDPVGPEIQNAFKYANFAFLPLSGNRRLWVFQINDPGLENFDHPEFLRILLLAFDAWFLEESGLQEGDVTIFDAKDFSLKIFLKLHIGLQRKLVKYQEDALPIRIKKMHLINAPTFVDKLFSLLKQIMSKELGDMLQSHLPNSDTLFQFFSKDELPKDFGGNLESMESYNQQIIDLIRKHSDTLCKDDLWKSPKK